MSQTPPLPSPVAAAAEPLAPPPLSAPAASGRARRWASWLLGLALGLAVLALIGSGMLRQRLDFIEQELVRRSQDSQIQALEARRLATQAEALVKELQVRLGVAELRLSEVSLQRSQLEELMLAVSRSRDDNLVQELDSTLRLAQQQAQLTGSAQPLIAALQAADQRIARAAQPRLNPVQRAIVRDIERIQATALVDVPSVALRLDELARQVDDWPLRNAVGPGMAPRSLSNDHGQRTDTPALAERNAAEPAGTGINQVWSRLAAGWQSLWSRVWVDLTRSGRELVRVSRIEQPQAALLAPEQGLFLRENLKLRLLNARLGLLARHMASSQADLASVEVALERYFDAAAPLVRSAQRTLSEVRQDMLAHRLPRPDETLSALAAAAGGR